MIFKYYGDGERPDAEKKSCDDCYYLRGYVNLWCMNEEARKLRGTSIPGCSNCPHWKGIEKFRWYDYLNLNVIGVTIEREPIEEEDSK